MDCSSDGLPNKHAPRASTVGHRGMAGWRVISHQTVGILHMGWAGLRFGFLQEACTHCR